MVDHYGVIGHPVQHSLSPRIHQAFANAEKISLSYCKIEPPIDGFTHALQKFKADGGKGLNVTLPFKHEAFALADQHSEAAQQAQAASVLHWQDDGSLLADNYDGLGLVQDLTRNHHINLNHANILLIGAGGAARGILGPLLHKAPAKIDIVNRTKAKAKQLAENFAQRGHVNGFSFAELSATPYDLIINATSLGHQQQAPTLPDGLITKQTACYDLSYGHAAEPFLTWAKQKTCQNCFDGLGMLVEHNAAVFYLWFGIYPQTHKLISQLRAN